jgi:NADPH2:quinone reductase
MKTVLYKQYGPPQVLQVAEVRKPVPKKDEVLVRIKATTVTAADCLMRRGDTLLSRLLLGWFKPRNRYQILGTEFSGIVEAVGREVMSYRPGDEIYGFRGFGTGCYAEYKCMSAKGSLAKKPLNLNFEEAATVVDGATTAWFFLKGKANIQKGQKVLINGAAGSIGTFAVQLAKFYGAHVIGVCSTKNVALVKSLGADQVVDYTQEDFTRMNACYDIIFDTVGKSSFGKCRKALTAKGQYLTTAFTLTGLFQRVWTGWFGQKKAIVAMSLNKTEALFLLTKLFEAGDLKTVVDRYYTLEQLPEAHAYVETGRKRGNVVVKV